MSTPDETKPWFIICGTLQIVTLDDTFYGIPPIKQPFGVYENPGLTLGRTASDRVFIYLADEIPWYSVALRPHFGNVKAPAFRQSFFQNWLKSTS